MAPDLWFDNSLVERDESGKRFSFFFLLIRFYLIVSFLIQERDNWLLKCSCKMSFIIMHSVLMQLFFYFESSLNLPRIHCTTVQDSAEVCLCGSSSWSRLVRMCTEAFCLCFTVRPKHMGVPAAVPSPKMLNIPQVPLPVKPGVSV